MPEHPARLDPPTSLLTLELHPALRAAATAGDPLHEALERELTRGLAEILDLLGIPGRPLVEVTTLAEELPASRPLRLRVGGRLCRYPEELLLRLRSYIAGAPYAAQDVEPALVEWLQELPASAVSEFLVLACLEILKLRPSVLFGPEQATAYRELLAQEAEERELAASQPSAAELLPLLAPVLDMRISLADRARVAEVLQEQGTQLRSLADLSEELIVALRPRVLEIRLPREHLERLTTAAGSEEQGLFTLMRDGLFYELGTRYPPLAFVPDETLRPGCFRFRVNHLTTPPWSGLRSDQRLVNDTPERLRLLGIDAVPALNPANYNAFGVIDVSAEPAAQAAELTIWDPLGYLVLCLSTDLREAGACLLDRSVVEENLSLLEQAFPALVEAVRQRVSTEQLTRVLRRLVAQQLAIRDLRAILESVLDFDYIVTDPSSYIVFDDRLPTATEPDQAWLDDPVNLSSFVRTGMKRYISHKYTRGQSTLIAYLLDPEIERLLSRAPLAEEEQERVLAAVRSEVGSLPALAGLPTILTTIDVCPPLRELIAPELPRLPVLGYQELAPELNIQPIARITLDS